MKKKTKKKKVFKTLLTGSARQKVVNEGRRAARLGRERKSPHVNCRAEGISVMMIKRITPEP